MINNLYGNMDLLTAAMDGSALRHETINNNLANVNTPGFKKTTTSFEEELNNIITNKNTKLNLKKTDEKHMGKDKQTLKNFEPTMNIHKETSTRRDKNNVNPDIEMINLAKTTIMYNALTDQVNRRFSKIQSVITEGGK